MCCVLLTLDQQCLGHPLNGAPSLDAAQSLDAAFITATDLLIDGGYVAFKGRIDTDGRPAMI